jgi:hypothetical protein
MFRSTNEWVKRDFAVSYKVGIQLEPPECDK